MKISALIPARKNSKRIPKKNKIIFFKQPLFMWTIKLAKKIPEISDILISTDDNQILKIAKFCRKNLHFFLKILLTFAVFSMKFMIFRTEFDGFFS